MSATALLRFRKEFRAVADVVHPNLVRLFELLGDAALWSFTMEYVDGQPFIDHIRPPSGEEVEPLTRLRAALPQLIEAVATVPSAPGAAGV